MYARTFRKCTPVQDAAGDGDGVEAGGKKRLAALGTRGKNLVFSTACLQRCQRNERGMRIRREKVPGIRGKAVHFPGGDREDGHMGGGDGSACRGPVLRCF